MGNFLTEIPRGFRMLARFGGRDRPAQFWPYAVTIILLDFIAGFALMAPAVIGGIARMQRFAAEHPEQVTVESGPGRYSMTIHGYHPELMPDLDEMAAGFGLMAAATVLLLGAAVARRLHDRGFRGMVGSMPVPFLAFGLLVMPRLLASFKSGGAPDLRLFLALFVNNLIYLAALLLLAVLLAQPGDIGPNQFGPDPCAKPA